MSECYVLDTATVSDFLNGQQSIAKHIERAGLSQLRVAFITAGELLYGAHWAEKNGNPHFIEIYNHFLTTIQIIHSNDQVFQIYADLKTQLRINHNRALHHARLYDNDLWIAATAKAYQAVVVSADKGFKKIPGLRVEDWLK